MTVTVDGTAYSWTATAHRTSIGGQTSITVAGADTSGSGKGGGFTLSNISATGTYDVGTVIINGTSAQTVTMVYTPDNNTQYTSPLTGTTSVGKVTVTELTTTSIKATFNATLTKQSGTGANTVTLTNGSVNATIM